MRELFKLCIVLTVICCCAALSLAYVYQLTKDPIAYQKRQKKIRAINAVFPRYEDAAGLDIVRVPVCDEKLQTDGACKTFYHIKNNRAVLGIAFEVSRVSGYGGDINLMLGVLPGGEISGIKIIEHHETPGLGAKITNEKFYQQFSGKTLEGTAWKLSKNGGDIDQVSGATISSTAVLTAVREGLKMYSEHKEAIMKGDNATAGGSREKAGGFTRAGII